MFTAIAFRRAATLIVLALLAPAAHAQLFRAYLASGGSDSNPCTITQPCRLLPAALNAVAGGGEIWMLDSANYNTAIVTVTKSVTILAVPGVVGSVVATGGPAIRISAAGLKVVLRNLAIGPVATLAPGTVGVEVTGASTVTIEKCVIANLPQDGVQVVGAGRLKVTESTLRDNAYYAIRLYDGADADIVSTRMHGNGFGGVAVVSWVASTTTTAGITDSAISGGGSGVTAHTYADGAVTRASMTRSTITGSTFAFDIRTQAAGTAQVNVGGSTVVDSTVTWSTTGAGASFVSLGNNQFSGGGSSSPRTILPPQ